MKMQTLILVGFLTAATLNQYIAELPPDGGTIVLPGEDLVLTEPLIISRSDVTLVGDGTKLIIAKNANCPGIIVGDIKTPADISVTNVSIRNLTIDGQCDEQQFERWEGPRADSFLIRNNGITIRHANFVTIQNVKINHARSGGIVIEKDSRNITVEDADLSDNYYDGLAAYETEDSVFRRISATNNRAAGISVDWAFNHNLVIDCDLSYNKEQGIFMRYSRNNSFVNNRVYGNRHSPIFIAQVDNDVTTAAVFNLFLANQFSWTLQAPVKINDLSCFGNVTF